MENQAEIKKQEVFLDDLPIIEKYLEKTYTCCYVDEIQCVFATAPTGERVYAQIPQILSYMQNSPNCKCMEEDDFQPRCPADEISAVVLDMIGTQIEIALKK